MSGLTHCWLEAVLPEPPALYIMHNPLIMQYIFETDSSFIRCVKIIFKISINEKGIITDKY